MRHIDLFSGIGGFALAASWVWGPDHHIVSLCEIDPFCRKILNKHWPDAPVHDDIKTLEGKPYAGTIDILTGGFPCQPYSVAGKRKGKEDDRALWPEMLRVIQEAKPRWIIGENVTGFVNMGLDDCLSDLEGEGYETTSFIIPACAVNAPHRRDRTWIVANRQSWKNDMRICGGMAETQEFRERINPTACIGDQYASNAQNLNSRSGLCKTGSKQNGDQPSDGSGVATHTSRQRLQGGQRTGTHDERPAPHGSVTECHSAWDEPWIEAATRLCRVDDGISRQMDRTKRLKALGNAIVPQVAFKIMKAIEFTQKHK